jgi:hypothetical protein
MSGSFHRVRVYVDCSVFGGTEDEQFRIASSRFFSLVHKGEYVVLACDVMLDELEDAPDAVRQVYDALPKDAVEQIEVGEEARLLAAAYLEAGVLGSASEADALQVAVATVAGADLILSWNFRHIVNFSRIRGFNSVNMRSGYRTMSILSPLEVVDESENQGV